MSPKNFHDLDKRDQIAELIDCAEASLQDAVDYLVELSNLCSEKNYNESKSRLYIRERIIPAIEELIESKDFQGSIQYLVDRLL